MARIVDQRILQKQPLDQVESENFDLFVACMFMRTERMKESIGTFVSAKARIEKDYAQADEKPIPDSSVMEHNAHAHATYDGILFISEELAKMSHNVFVAPAGSIQPKLPLSPFQGLKMLWTVDPGRRSRTRFALGYFLSGFQPLRIGCRTMSAISV